MPNSFNTTNTKWEKPAWASNTKLKPSRKGQFIKEQGNLEAPITDAPHDVDKEPAWATNNVLRESDKGQFMKEEGNLEAPITEAPHLDEQGPFEKPEWTGKVKPNEESEVKEAAPVHGEFFSDNSTTEGKNKKGLRALFGKKKKEEPKEAPVEEPKKEEPKPKKKYTNRPKDYPPRSGWVIVFMEDLEAQRIASAKKDDIRIGKLCVDFKGLYVHEAVENFEEWYKGVDIDPKTLVADAEMPLQLVAGSHSKTAFDNCEELVGVIFEGAEALSTMQSAGPECRFYIRQAHVFPVKVAKTR